MRICNDINKELAQKQKVIVLVQLFEFVKSNGGEVSQPGVCLYYGRSRFLFIPHRRIPAYPGFHPA